ncbi:hypothetical protein [Arthrobacter globiformis]|nr:hypothetical protein [Arthrobacter globiformis]
MTQTDLAKERDAYKAAAQREHQLMRQWQARAQAAEAQLKLYQAREKQQ